MRSHLSKLAIVFSLLFAALLLSIHSSSSAQAASNATTLNPSIFTHIATSLNSTGNWTDLDNQAINNNPNALVFVTPNWNPGGSGGVYENHAIGVWYHSGKWAIFNQDGTAIPNGAAFNVYALPYANTANGVFIHTATTSNSAGDWTDINNTLVNNNPNALLMVTANWNPGGSGGVYENHAIGVWYHGGKWAIFNQDGTAIPSGASFNVVVLRSSPGSQVFVHTATTANSAGNVTDLSNAVTDNHRDALVFVMPSWNVSGSAVYENHNIGVWYHGSQWSIFNQDGAAMPTNAAFNVLAIRLRAV